MGTKRKRFCWLLFATAEIIVLAVAAGYFYVLDHGPLHLALTVIFLLCHIALCALARGKWFCLLFGGYWAIALLLRIYRLLYMYGLPPVSGSVPVYYASRAIGLFFPDTGFLYVPSQSVGWSGVFLMIVSAAFIFIYIKKLMRRTPAPPPAV